MKLATERELRRSIALHGHSKVSIGNFVLAFRVKTDPDGALLEEEKYHKPRLTFADKRAMESKAAMNYYSACVSSSSSRLVSQIAVEHRAFQHTLDVSGAYYKGVRPTIAEGDRLIYARVPSWLADYGNFPTHGEDGSPNYIWITGNMAGCADAGCIWETAYDKHLINVQKMTQ